MVHHILQCALREEIVLPPEIGCMAANHFVGAVFAGAGRLFMEPGLKAGRLGAWWDCGLSSL